jgi:hypothetical protein
MRRIFLLACAVLAVLAAPAAAQSFEFAEVPWGSTPEEAAVVLQRAGFTPAGADSVGDPRFAGRLFGWDAEAVANLSGGKVVRFMVVFPQRAPGYRPVADSLTAHYGDPAESFPDAAFWLNEASDGTYGISIDTFGPGRGPRLFYESPAWGAEARRRRRG